MKRTVLASLVLSALSCVSQPMDASKVIQEPIKKVITFDASKLKKQSELEQKNKAEQHPESYQLKEKQPENFKLYVNTDPTKHYSVKKNKSEGEKDIAEIALNGSLEEVWIFNEKEGIWYECGVDEKTSTVLSDTRGIYAYIEDCIKYHPHNSKSKEIDKAKKIQKKIIKEKKSLIDLLNTNDISFDAKKQVQKDLKRLSNLEANVQTNIVSVIAFPSVPEDFEHCIESYFRGAVVSEYGIIEFSNIVPEESTWEKTKIKLKKVFKELKKDYYFTIQYALKEKIKSGDSFEDSINYAIEKFNDRFKGKLKLTYRLIIHD